MKEKREEIKVIGKIEVKRVNKCKKNKNKAKRGSEKQMVFGPIRDTVHLYLLLTRSFSSFFSTHLHKVT
jgi:hypothetical protein